MAALYELTGSYRQLLDAAVDWETGEVNEERVPEFNVLLAKLEGDLKGKLEGCAKALRMMDVDMAALKAEEERLEKRRKSIEASKKALRSYMAGCLGHANLTNVKTPLFTIYIVDGKESVDIFDEEAIPMGCRKVPGRPPPDKTLIGAMLKEGKEVAGARLVKGEPILNVR